MKKRARVYTFLFYITLLGSVSCGTKNYKNINSLNINDNVNSDSEVIYFRNNDKKNSVGKSCFINLNEEINIKTTKYKRFKLTSNNEIVADGFWSVNLKDTIYFIPYNAYVKGCDVKLKFYIKNGNSSHFLGRNCDKEDYHVDTDVLVENKNFKKINKHIYNKFYHSIFVMDYAPAGVIPDPVSRRCFLINLDYGIFYDGKFEEEYSIYWYNY